jgi:hypothetical protein
MNKFYRPEWPASVMTLDRAVTFTCFTHNGPERRPRDVGWISHAVRHLPLCGGDWRDPLIVARVKKTEDGAFSEAFPHSLCPHSGGVGFARAECANSIVYRVKSRLFE